VLGELAGDMGFDDLAGFTLSCTACP